MVLKNAPPYPKYTKNGVAIPLQRYCVLVAKILVTSMRMSR
uniref:Uncharacterized protein n=1 Tax=Setaria italica TaxID=4555 RepID=K4AP27_SETIT